MSSGGLCVSCALRVFSPWKSLFLSFLLDVLALFGGAFIVRKGFYTGMFVVFTVQELDFSAIVYLASDESAARELGVVADR